MAKPRKPQQSRPSTTESTESPVLESMAAAREELPAAQSSTGDTQRPDRPTEDYSRAALPTDETGERTTDDAQIRARAYELYIERGVAQGDELGDWLRAEREVRSRSTSTGTEADRSPPAA